MAQFKSRSHHESTVIRIMCLITVIKVGCDRRKDHGPCIGRVVIAVKITMVSRIPSCCIFVMLYESRGYKIRLLVVIY